MNPEAARAEAAGCKIFRDAERRERLTGKPMSIEELAAARRVVTAPIVDTLVGILSIAGPAGVATGQVIRSDVLAEGLDDRWLYLRAGMSTTCNMRPAHRELLKK